MADTSTHRSMIAGLLDDPSECIIVLWYPQEEKVIHDSFSAHCVMHNQVCISSLCVTGLEGW